MARSEDGDPTSYGETPRESRSSERVKATPMAPAATRTTMATSQRMAMNRAEGPGRGSLLSFESRVLAGPTSPLPTTGVMH